MTDKTVYGIIYLHKSFIGHINPFRYRGYYFDDETGLYYLQSRYYDPEVGRFINGDHPEICVYLCSSIINSDFSYCSNSPVSFRDVLGYAIDVILDVASLVTSTSDLISEPSLANFAFWSWDIVAMIVPIAPGSYIKNGGKLAINVAESIDDLADSKKIVTGTYKKLNKMLKGKKQGRIQVHHLVEKRFRPLFKPHQNDFLSIPLDKDLHQVFTNR